MSMTNYAAARKFITTPSLGWRWCYYINIIAVGLAIILLFFFYHPPTFELLHERKSKKEILKKLDCKLQVICTMLQNFLTDTLGRCRDLHVDFWIVAIFNGNIPWWNYLPVAIGSCYLYNSHRCYSSDLVVPVGIIRRP
jgi:MFS family permease